MATLADIKNKIGIQTLELSTATDATGEKTDWLRHWDNDTRTAVSIHRELATELKSNPAITSLALQSEQRVGEQGPYTAHRIVKYSQEAELIL